MKIDYITKLKYFILEERYMLAYVLPNDKKKLYYIAALNNQILISNINILSNKPPLRSFSKIRKKVGNMVSTVQIL